MQSALALLTTAASGQKTVFNNQQHFDVEDGLPQSYVSDIVQDKDGFIWAGTYDGLARYDGRGFRTFRYRPNDSTSFTANTIQGFGPLVDNTITLFYEGIREDIFNLETHKITRSHARATLEKIPGAIWQIYGVGSVAPQWLFIMSGYRGVGWLDNSTGQVHYANKANKTIKQDTVSAMTQSAEGRLYLVGENGVEVSDPSRKEFTFVPFATHIPRLSAGLKRDDYYTEYSIVCLPDNRLAVYTGEQITILDVGKRTSLVYKIPAPAKSETSAIGKLMQVDSNGQPCFVYYGRIYRLSDTGELKLLWQNKLDPSLRITALLIDRSDVLWVSVNAQGLLKINLQSLPFQSYGYRSNFVSDLMEHAGVNHSNFPKHWEATEASYYFKQVYDSSGNMFVSNNFYGKNDGEVYGLSKQYFFRLPSHGRHTKYTAMVMMPGNELWTFEELNSSWHRWKKDGAKPEILPVDPRGLRPADLADAKYIAGSIWLSTYNQGLLQCDGNRTINQFTGIQPNGFMPNNLTEICIDPSDPDKFWIGSRGGGLILWDIHKGLQQVYTMADGLPNNTIYCILPDEKGNLWCSTNKGIFRFDITAKLVTAFEKADGLAGNEFNRAHKFKFPDGRIAFGGLEGYTIFNPADFDKIMEAGEMPVLLTGLQINSQPQDFNLAGSLVKEPITTVSKIDLPYYKNALRFEFAALLFNQPQKIKYRYQLKGADDDWVENGTNNVAAYAALRPGQYIFRVNATGDNGLWSTSTREISIRIHPPFWATWWAYTIYALLAIGLVKWYLIIRERSIKTRQNLAFEKREALRLKEIDEMKDRFFSNITHEFRTPLTLIISPLEKLAKDNSLSENALGSVKTAQRNSKQLLGLINEFLDFSKLDQGQMRLKLSTGEVDQVVAGCLQSFQPAFLEKNLQLTFSSGEVKGFYTFDEEKWQKIITNLLGNAIKFAPVNGVVSVLLAEKPNDIIRFEVANNGPAIPAAQQHKIFDRFYQLDNSSTRNTGGTGIGLSLVKELTQLMQGTISLESQPGEMTRFIIELPVQKMVVKEMMTMVESGNKMLIEHELKNGEAPLLLIVEDNDELRAFLAESLAKDYRILQEADGLNAWTTIIQELPDIVISDVMIPGQDGFDLCTQCKTDNRTAHIGFILLTSKAAQEARLTGLAKGADDYITKPFHLEELELRTANLLGLQQKQRAFLKFQFENAEPGKKMPVINDPFLLKIYQEMDARLDDPSLGVEHLCKVMAMSRSTLNRKLKSLLDISPNDLVRQYRLQKSTHLLTSGQDISTTAYKVGFSSPSYFSQCFKERYGYTPSDWVEGQA